MSSSTARPAACSRMPMSVPDLPYDAMDNHTLLYDLIYNPDETLFLTKGKKKGATIKNGLEMLLLQAFASWEFWNS